MKLLLVLATILLCGVATTVRCDDEAIEVSEPLNENTVADEIVEDEEENDDDEDEEDVEDEDEEEADPGKVTKVVHYSYTSKPVMVKQVKQVKVYSSSHVVTHSSSSSSSSSAKCVPAGFSKLGCWKDTAKPRAVPSMEKYLGGGDYTKRKDAINKCYKVAA